MKIKRIVLCAIVASSAIGYAGDETSAEALKQARLNGRHNTLQAFRARSDFSSNSPAAERRRNNAIAVLALAAITLGSAGMAVGRAVSSVPKEAFSCGPLCDFLGSSRTQADMTALIRGFEPPRRVQVPGWWAEHVKQQAKSKAGVFVNEDALPFYEPKDLPWGSAIVLSDTSIPSGARQMQYPSENSNVLYCPPYEVDNTKGWVCFPMEISDNQE